MNITNGIKVGGVGEFSPIAAAVGENVRRSHGNDPPCGGFCGGQVGGKHEKRRRVAESAARIRE